MDLLHGSHATIVNCLFVGNVANMGVDVVGLLGGAEYRPEHGSGALTVFDGSRAVVSRSTCTGNWNGVDDNGAGSTYVDSIFWKNTLKGGISPESRYELDIVDGAGVRGSFIHGDVNDLRGTINRDVNTMDPPDPRFDAQFVPQAAQRAHRSGYPAGEASGAQAGNALTAVTDRKPAAHRAEARAPRARHRIYLELVHDPAAVRLTVCSLTELVSDLPVDQTPPPGGRRLRARARQPRQTQCRRVHHTSRHIIPRDLGRSGNARPIRAAVRYRGIPRALEAHDKS